MVTGKDILQGILAFKTMSDAMAGHPRDDMYRYLLGKEKENAQANQRNFGVGFRGGMAGINTGLNQGVTGAGGGTDMSAFAAQDASPYDTANDSYAEGGMVAAGSDPEIAKREARRNYQTTHNEEGDESDNRKLDDQTKKWRYEGGHERNAQGDTWASWMFADHNNRLLNYEVGRGEHQMRMSDPNLGQTPPPQFNRGGAVPAYQGGGIVRPNLGLDHIPHFEDGGIQLQTPYSTAGTAFRGGASDQAPALDTSPPSPPPNYTGLGAAFRGSDPLSEFLATIPPPEDHDVSDQFAREKMNRDIGPPRAGRMDTRMGGPWIASGEPPDWHGEAVKERDKTAVEDQAARNLARDIPLPTDQPLTPSETRRLNQERALAQGKAEEATIAAQSETERLRSPGGATESEDPRTSKVGRVARDVVSAIGAALPHETEQSRSLNEINRQIAELVKQRQEADPGLLEATTRAERVAAQDKITTIDAQIGELMKRRQQAGANRASTPPAGVDSPAPVTPASPTPAPGPAPAISTTPPTTPAPPPTPVPTAAAPAAAPPQGSTAAVAPGMPARPPAPTAAQQQPGRGLDSFVQPDMSSSALMGPALAMAPGAPAIQTKPTPPVAGPSTPPGGGTPTAAGVAPGAAAAAGTSTPGSIGAGTPPSPVPGPQGAIPDPNRVQAFNPATERGVGAVDASGRVVTQPGNQGADVAGGTGLRPGGANQGMSSNSAVNDFHQAAAGAHAGAVDAIRSGVSPQQIQQGYGAATPRATQMVINRYGAGGRLTHGQAIIAGMTAVYMGALERGDMKTANAYVFALAQRANIEAAVHGSAAAAALQAGDMHGAAHMIQRGLDWAPDGVKWQVGPDGKSFIATDLHGQKTTVPIDGAWIMKAALGLQDGSLIWNTINQHAAMLSKNQDKDAIGRALRNEKTGLEIQRLRQRLSGVGGRAAGTGGTFLSGLNTILNPNAPPPPQVNVSVAAPEPD